LAGQTERSKEHFPIGIEGAVAEPEKRTIAYRTIQVVYRPLDPQKKPFSTV